MPAAPRLEQVVVPAALVEDVLQIVEARHFFSRGRWRGAPGSTCPCRTCPSSRPPARRARRACLGVARRGERAAQLEQEELARDVGGELPRASKRAACLMARRGTLLASSAAAERASVSSVMKFSSTQDARDEAGQSRQVGVDAGDEGARLLHGGRRGARRPTAAGGGGGGGAMCGGGGGGKHLARREGEGDHHGQRAGERREGGAVHGAVLHAARGLSNGHPANGRRCCAPSPWRPRR